MSVKVPGGHCLLAGLPCISAAHIELVSLDSICKEVDCVAVAWFTLICPVASPDAMGACGTLAGGESGDAQTHHWDDLCTEFADVFETPSISQEHEIKHRIELLPSNTPPSKWQYRMSPLEMAKVHR